MVHATILHVSDLHIGWPYVPEVGEALIRAASGIAPDVCVVSGDFVQRGDFLRLWRDARDYVARLPKPLLGVPGNHDIPLWNPLRRATAPFDRYREFISADLDPVLHVENATVAGINTARPWVIDLGYVSDWQLERVAKAFAEGPERALRVAVMHHPPMPQAETGIFRHHVYGHKRAIRALAEAHAEVILCGHNHYPKCKALIEYVPYAGGLVLAQAGTATSMRLRPRSGHGSQEFNVVRAVERELTVEAWVYDGGGFRKDREARFERRPRLGTVKPV